jgi:hypothetical protein
VIGFGLVLRLVEVRQRFMNLLDGAERTLDLALRTRTAVRRSAVTAACGSGTRTLATITDWNTFERLTGPLLRRS